jgi:crotonobetainyl-CoA:carnitine CoA-transferase CaiB-like acyl-CoA transferase
MGMGSAGDLPPPLAGFRVLDLTRFLAGPYAAMVLADLGADVIKVEQPGGGDNARGFGPFHESGESWSFIQVNRGKRSVALDLKDPRGAALVRRLAARSDLVLESFRPGVAARFGLSYDDVRALRPDVLFCSVSAFGQTGPYAHRPGFDIMAQGVTGVLRMTGQPDGRPAKVGFAAADIAAGMTAVQAVLAAQLVRAATGQGQYIDVALTDSLLAWTVWEAGGYFGAGNVPRPAGTRHRLSAPYQAFRTSDGYVTIAAFTGPLWERTARVLGAPQWLDDPRFATPEARLAHPDELEEAIEAVTAARSTAEWLALLETAGVPAGPVLRYDETLHDEQVTAREMIREMDHPLMGPVRTLGQPAKYGRSPAGAYARPAPWLGQHTAAVLRDELGCDTAQINELIRAGVAYDKHPELTGLPGQDGTGNDGTSQDGTSQEDGQ